MNGIGWITVAEAARLCGTDELRITLWMNGNHIAYARFDGTPRQMTRGIWN